MTYRNNFKKLIVINMCQALVSFYMYYFNLYNYPEVFLLLISLNSQGD